MDTNIKNDSTGSCEGGKSQSSAFIEAQQTARDNRVADLLARVYNARSINGKGANVRACDIVPNAYSYAEAIAEEWYSSSKTAEDYRLVKNKLELLHKALTDGELQKIVFNWHWSESGLVVLKVKELTSKPYFGFTEHKITSGDLTSSFLSWAGRSHALKRLLITSLPSDEDEDEDGIVIKKQTLPMFRSSLTLNDLRDFFKKLGWTTASCCIPHQGEDLYVAIFDHN